MSSRFEWTGIGLYVSISVLALVLVAWQAQVDRSVFDRFFGAVNPIWAIVGAALAGALALAYLQGSSDLAVTGPGTWRDAVLIVAWVVPLFAAAAIGADLVLRYAEDTNVVMPDALRFYPAIAVFVEIALHAVPIALLVAILGPPTGLDVTFWRLAIPVALIEAALQAGYATSTGTAVFSACHLMAFGLTQLWMFWRFGFAAMLGLRLVYYSLWHLAWGAVRLKLLF